MIFDSLAQSSRYEPLHPLFRRAFAFLRDADLRQLTAGRHDIDGDQLFVVIDDVEGRGREGAKLEAHRAYIDIQVAIDGTDLIGWRPLQTCRAPEPFDESRDIGFFGDAPDTWVSLEPGVFAVFFPEDAHAPLGSDGAVTKAIVKIRCQ